jgi:DNA-binding NtrC family response regulator
MGTARQSLLLVSSAASERMDLAGELNKLGLTVREASSAEEILQLWQDWRPSAVCVHHPATGPFDGLEIIRCIRRIDSSIPVILASERSSEGLLLQALRAGASDFLPWPPSPGALLDWVSPAVKERALAPRPLAEGEASGGLRHGEGFVGEAAAICSVRRQIARAAQVASNVLITGDTGTGKELVAELIHRNSARSGGPFVPVSCAAIPEALFESEMFGVVRGAFTGAYVSRNGTLKWAEGGTLFLDEIGEMPLGAQAKFLRAIERKEVQRLGDHRTSRIDVRIITATNQDLEDLVRQRKFRPDLFFRLDVLRIALPPLRERASDIPLLVTHFLKQLSAQLGGGARLLDDRALEVVCRHDWPGNVRELRNILEAAMARASTPVLGVEDLPGEFLRRVDQIKTTAQSEKDLLISALLAVDWDKSKAARRLQWSRATLYRKLAQYSIAQPISSRPRR